MNINQLRYFVSAAENRSFTKAAAQYYISQTAVTQQIQALEDMVGVALFDRSSRLISLTPAGRGWREEVASAATNRRLLRSVAQPAVPTCVWGFSEASWQGLSLRRSI